MEIIITIISILLITGVIWLLDKILPWYACPICAGVSGTWLWMLIGVIAGILPPSSFLLPIAIMMGGSVVGIAYQVEKKLPAGKSVILWKTLFIPASFAAVWGILERRWGLAAGALSLSVLFVLVFLAPGSEAEAKNDKIKELENKMKNCC